MLRFGLFRTLTASHLFLVQCLQPLVQFLNLLFQSCSVFLYLFQLCLQFGQFLLLLRTLGAEISRFLFHKIQVEDNCQLETDKPSFSSSNCLISTPERVLIKC